MNSVKNCLILSSTKDHNAALDENAPGFVHALKTLQEGGYQLFRATLQHTDLGHEIRSAEKRHKRLFHALLINSHGEKGDLDTEKGTIPATSVRFLKCLSKIKIVWVFACEAGVKNGIAQMFAKYHGAIAYASPYPLHQTATLIRTARKEIVLFPNDSENQSVTATKFFKKKASIVTCTSEAVVNHFIKHDSHYLLAVWYQLQNDAKRSRHHLYSAADAGCPYAHYWLGNVANIDPENQKKSLPHLIKAAETLSPAQHELGMYYQKTECFDLAARCFEAAYKNGLEESFGALEELAQQKHPYACYLLGNLFKQQSQWTHAYYWMSKAKEFGCSEASTDLITNQDTYARHLIQAGIECEAEDQELAFHFYRNATHCNSAFAMMQVARIFLSRGELDDAFSCLFTPKKHSLNGDELSALRNLQFQAGNYFYQIGDLTKADQLLCEAQRSIGKAALLRGLIHEKHQTDAEAQQQIVIASYRQAAKLKTPLASAFLGQFHLNLLVRNPNHLFSTGDESYLRAVYHFEKAAKSRDIWSLLSLAGLRELVQPAKAKQIYSSLLGRSSERRTKDDLDGISIVEMRARARKKVFVHAS